MSNKISFNESDNISITDELSYLYNKRIVRPAFTSKLIIYGPWRDTSISSLTKQIDRNNKRKDQQYKNLQKCTKQFNKQVNSLKSLQTYIINKQKSFAYSLIQQYSALCIQTIYRGYKARLFYRQLKAIHCIIRFLKIYIFNKKRKIAAKYISRIMKSYLTRKLFRNMVRHAHATKKLMIRARNLIIVKKSRRMLECTRLANLNYSTIQLFAITRAIKKLSNVNYNTNELKLRYYIKKLISNYHRRKRIKLLKGPKGPLVYFILSRILTNSLSKNIIIEYCNKRIKQLKLLNLLKLKNYRKKIYNISSYKSTSRPISSTLSNDSNVSLDIDILLSKMPKEMIDVIYFPKSLTELVIYINDLVAVAYEFPKLLDVHNIPYHLLTDNIAIEKIIDNKSVHNRKDSMSKSIDINRRRSSFRLSINQSIDLSIAKKPDFPPPSLKSNRKIVHKQIG